jgi:hypothetical protein
MTIAAPIGSYQVSGSPSATTPSSVEKIGITCSNPVAAVAIRPLAEFSGRVSHVLC